MGPNIGQRLFTLWDQANRSFGLFDGFVPSRRSTADIMQGAALGVAEAGNRYYPELAKTAVLAALPEAALARAGAPAKAEETLIMVNPRNLISQESKGEMNGSLVKRCAKDMKTNGFDQSRPVSAVMRADGRLVISDGHHPVAAAVKARIDKIPADVYKP